MHSEIDKENLYSVIKNIPDQLVQGLELAKDVKVDGQFKAIEISGMGGSCWPANILRIYLHDLFWKNPEKNHRFGIYQNRFYTLPPEAYDNCLNIISSYSGGTEEAVASFEEVLKNNLPCVALASGGKVAELAEKNNVPLARMPQGIQPRAALGYNFSMLFQLLVNAGMLEDKKREFQETVAKLKKNEEELRSLGESLAKTLKGKIPVIYSSTKFKSLAMVWKIMINENSKTPAFWNFFPELNHNEANSFVNPQGNFHLVMLRDKQDHPQNFKRFEVTAKVVKEYGTDSTIIDIPEGNILYRMFATLQVGCWTSYYLALEYRIDPTPVEIVEKFKVLLTK